MTNETYTKPKNSSLIRIEISEQDKITCKICGFVGKSKSALAGHIGSYHRVPAEQYIVQNYMNGKRPLCPICQKETLYVREDYGFRKYCVEHAAEGKAEWSRNNGFGTNQDAGWKKGLTKETHSGIRSQSEKMSGKNNPSSRTEEMYLADLKTIEQKGFKVLTPYSEYISNTQLLKTVCLKCGTEREFTLQTLLKLPICRGCRPE